MRLIVHWTESSSKLFIKVLKIINAGLPAVNVITTNGSNDNPWYTIIIANVLLTFCSSPQTNGGIINTQYLIIDSLNNITIIPAKIY